MKLFKHTIFPTLSFLLALAGCTKEIGVTDVKIGEDGANHAFIVNEETRTDFDSYVGKFTWSEGDVIAIHLTDGTFYETPVDPETKVFTSSTTSTKQRNQYAIYPASVRDNENDGNPTLNVILPDAYNITGKLTSDYSPVPMIAVNSEKESDLYFRHVGGLLRLTCDAVPAETKFISVTFDRPVTGTFTVANPSGSAPTISNGGSGNTITFTLSDTSLGEKTDDIILNIPLPTGPYTKVTTTAIDENHNEIYSVDRDVDFNIRRFHGRRMAYSLTEVLTDSMQLVVAVGDDTGWTFRIQFEKYSSYPADLEIEWGDDNTSYVSAGTNVEDYLDNITHSYASPGDYTITITATREGKGPMIPAYRTREENGQWVEYMLKSAPTPLLPMNVGEYYDGLFYNCFSLERICADLFSKNPQITYLSQTFYNCHQLQEIPAGLLNYLPDLEHLEHTFAIENIGSYIHSVKQGILSSGIPEDLFANNPKLKSVTYAFEGCDGISHIPENLFANNPEIISFQCCFLRCSGINEPIPSNLFVNQIDAENFAGVFSDCSGLYGSIPEDLFATNTKAVIFDGVFRGCSGLTGVIPENLFAVHPFAADFQETFAGCSGLTGGIPEILFKNQSGVSTFRGTFSGCSSLSGGIPDDLFSTNPDVTDFSCTFSGCDNLTGSIPASLFANQSKVTSFYGTFASCEHLSGGIPPGLFATNPLVEDFSATFWECRNLTGTIPASLFAAHPDVRTFSDCFTRCSLLSGEIPSDLFSHQNKVTNFSGTFCSCTGLTGSIPGDLFVTNPHVESFWETFYNCYNLSGSIPATLFNEQTEAYSFGGTFYSCSGLTGEIPANLFANNTKAYDFYSCFRDCFRLKLRPDIFGSLDRFSNMTEACSFTSCFYRCGYQLDDAGNAPALWSTNFGGGVYYEGCFYDATTLSNYPDIPDDWKSGY